MITRRANPAEMIDKSAAELRALQNETLSPAEEFRRSFRVLTTLATELAKKTREENSVAKLIAPVNTILDGTPNAQSSRHELATKIHDLVKGFSIGFSARGVPTVLELIVLEAQGQSAFDNDDDALPFLRMWPEALEERKRAL